MFLQRHFAFVILVLMFCVHDAPCTATERRDERVVYDASSLSLAGEENCGLFAVKPDTNSPEYKTEGVYIEGSTGETIKTPDFKVTQSVHGAITLLAPLGMTSKVPTQYSWNFLSGRRGPRSHDHQSEDGLPFSPFYYSGGTVIFRYNEKAEGAAKFNPVYLIPDEWAKFVPPAFKFQQANKQLFDETKVAANFKPLTALLADKNPFNAIAAARVLAPERGLDTAFVAKDLASSSGYMQAIFAYLTFKNAHQLRQEAIDNALGQVIDKAPSAATLKWITLGLTTAQNDDANSYFALKDRARALLLRVDKRQKTLNTETSADDYVNELLTATKVRERPATTIETRRAF